MKESTMMVEPGCGFSANKVLDSEEKERGLRLLLPNKRHPYYIVTPKYERRSAGIKVLHMLCNALNRAGERAYIITRPYCVPDRAVNGGLLTPLLTKGIVNHDYQSGLTPIMIYPETVAGNPYDAPFVVRYVLNYPGLLGGDASYSEDEYCVTYSQELAKATPNTRMTLFVPASDPEVFKPEPKVSRSGSCFYAGKYKEIHKGELFDITLESTEIYRELPAAQSQEDIAEIFHRSEVFYTYENTALVIEALLCECPVVFLPNPYLKNSIAAHELGWDGIAWGTDAAEITRAKSTVRQGRENYLKLFVAFEYELSKFIAQTQLAATSKPYAVSVNVRFPLIPKILQFMTEKIDIFYHISEESGMFTAIVKIVKKPFKFL